MNHVLSLPRLRKLVGRLARRGGLALLLALATITAAGTALADASICTSRDVVQFGNRSVGSSSTENVTVTNCGDRAWSFTGVSLHPATGPAFHVTTACATGLTLAPGQTCAIAITFAPTVAGQTSGGLWLHSATTTPDQIVTFYGRGIDGQAATTSLGFAPAAVAFGAQEVGTQSGAIAVELKNLGPGTFTPSAIVINGPAAYNFPAFPETCRVGTAVAAGASCRLGMSFAPDAPGLRYGNLVIDAPELPALAIMQISGIGVKGALGNVSGLWWNAPAGSESGWGLHFAHQGATIFATWFTFGLDGKPLWLVAAATWTATNTYTGTLYTGTGPPFGATPFDPALVTKAPVGTATFTFIDGNSAIFAYAVNGIAQTKAIVRETFASPVPTCTWGAQADLAAGTNFQDIWWAAPAGSESGWGINFTHQGDVLFATWFTFAADGKPRWLVVAAPKTAPYTYAGTLYTGTGPPFNAVPFDPAKVTRTPAGAATFAFADGNHATFTSTVDGITQVKALTRQVFAPPGTLCK